MLPCTLPFDFIEPCLPATAYEPPSGEQWSHEIMHDGYRLIAWKEPGRTGVDTAVTPLGG
jgi:ATP-dependent DNA ligase